MTTFFYLIPEQHKVRNDGEGLFQYLQRRLLNRKRQLPSGGVKIIYQHCDILNRSGYTAVPVHLGDFIVDWFPHQSDPLHFKEAIREMKESDILICPEVVPDIATKFPCKTKIAFIQNWALADLRVGPGKRYEDYGFSRLLSCSKYIQSYMKPRSSLPCHVVTNGIDLDVFHAEGRKKNGCKVVLLNRRNIADAEEAIRMLGESAAEVEISILENRYSQAEIADLFRDADVFLAIGYPEGFALPPLEAMACGCAVVGFTGGGGREHMIDGETALVATDGNVKELAGVLEKVIHNSALKERIRAAGLKKAQQFSMENMENQLIHFARVLCSSSH